MQKKRKTNSKIAPKKNTARKPAAKKVVTKKPVAKKTPVKKTTTRKPAAKKPVTKKTTTKTALRKTPVKKIQSSKMQTVRNGEFHSINTKRVQGHKGEIKNKKKNGTATAIIVTHSEYTRGRKNIPLKENPQPNDKRTAYAVTKPEKVKLNKKNIGKHHKDMKVKNSTDKSIIRNIAKR